MISNVKYSKVTNEREFGGTIPIIPCWGTLHTCSAGVSLVNALLFSECGKSTLESCNDGTGRSNDYLRWFGLILAKGGPMPCLQRSFIESNSRCLIHLRNMPLAITLRKSARKYLLLVKTCMVLFRVYDPMTVLLHMPNNRDRQWYPTVRQRQRQGFCHQNLYNWT